LTKHSISSIHVANTMNRVCILSIFVVKIIKISEYLPVTDDAKCNLWNQN